MNPAECLAIVYLGRKSKSDQTSERREFWRFLFVGDPDFIEVMGFDPSGTEWEPLVESLHELEAAALEARASTSG